MASVAQDSGASGLTDIDAQRKVATILRVLAEAGRPVGGTSIARELRLRGIDLKQRMVRYYLQKMDARGLTENLGRSGRRLTRRGRRELESAVAVDRVGFVSARVDELTCRLTFDLEREAGTVIMNVSMVPSREFDKAKRIAKKVIAAGLGMGRFVASAGSGERLAGFAIPTGRTGLGTVCSVTLNGVLCAHGIPIASEFGGLLELRDGRPHRFVQIIHYDAATIDPIEIFLKGRMTSVGDAARTGTGTIGASFREVPAVVLPKAAKLIEALERLGLGGVLAIGIPGKALLDVPVSQGRVGLVVAAGLNPVAAVEEAGIPTENRAMASLCEFDELLPCV
jgi:repressor of nif and glnA expression